MAPGEDELLTIALDAARAAAAELLPRFGARLEIRAKSSPTDLVSEADEAAEAAIREVLGQRRPQDAILGEEGGATGDGDLRWVVDPLDGTINYLFSIPQWAVSVACEDADGAIVGVVLDAVRDECFTVTRSGAPQLNGTTIAPSGREDLAISLIGTGFAYDSEIRARQAQVLTRVLPQVRDIRRAGAAALDLAWVACGRLDGYWERGVKPWDIAAGSLLCERGGLVTAELPDGEDGPAGILTGPRTIVDQLRGLILG